MAAHTLTYRLPLINKNGQTIVGGKINFFLPGGSATPKEVWSNEDLSTSAGVSVDTDSYGMPENSGTSITVYGDGNYYVVYEDDKGDTIDDFEWLEDVGQATFATVAAMKLVDGGFDGRTVYLKGYYADGDGGAGQVYWDAASTETPDDAMIFQVTGVTTGRWKRILNGEITPQMGGAKGNGTTNDIAALIAVDTAAKANGLKMVGHGTYLISAQWTLTCNVIDFSNALIQMDASFPSSEAVIFSGYSNDSLKIALRIDGDKANQTGNGVGVAIRGVSSPFSQIYIDAVDCKTGVLVDGNSEKLNVHVGGKDCDILVDQKINTATPDENNYWISASLCDMFFRQSDSTSANVVFNCESNAGATDFAVKILSTKYTTLSGILRGLANGGVEISDTGQVANVNFANLMVYSVSGDYAVYAYEGRMITGNLNVSDVSAGGVYIGYMAGGANIDITVEALTGGSGLRLGTKSVKDFRFGNIRYNGYGNTGVAFGVDIDSVSGHLTLDMSTSDHTLVTNNISGHAAIKCSSRHITGDIEISKLDETPAIEFIGGKVTRAQLAAYSYPYDGMRVDLVPGDATAFDSADQSAYYQGGNWSNTILTVTTGSPTLPTNGIIYLDSSGGAITATLPNADVLYQRVMIYMSNATTTSTVSVTKHETSDPEVFTFDSTSDRLILEWMGADWRTVSNYNVAV